jgi:hypothetical protein
MSAIRASALAAALFAALALAACGGGDGGEASDAHSEEAVAKVPPAVLAKANANCRYLLRETRRIGREAVNGAPETTLELATEGLVKPSIPLLERVADRQQALEAKAHSPLFSLYANLFDPIVVLAQKRLRVGQEGDYAGSKQIEETLTDLGLEQRRYARLARLGDCDLDFQHTLLESLNE